MALPSFNSISNSIKGAIVPGASFQKPMEPPASVQLNPRQILEKYGERKVIFNWSAPLRLSKFNFNKRSIRSLSIIGIVVALVLALMGEIVLLFLIGSMIFIVVAFNRSEHAEVEYSVTSHGLVLEEKTYYWYQLDKFFFYNTDGNNTLVVDTLLVLPRRLFIPLSANINIDEIRDYLSQNLQFLKEAPSDLLDRTYKSVANKFDL